MTVWIVLLVSSFAGGVLCGAASHTNRGLLAGAIIPVVGFFAALMYQEYFVPYPGGGASMWPIALIFGGIPAATCGLVGAFAAQQLRKRRSSTSRT